MLGGGGKSTGKLWKVALTNPVPLLAMAILLPTLAPGCSLLGGRRNFLGFPQKRAYYLHGNGHYLKNSGMARWGLSV